MKKIITLTVIVLLGFTSCEKDEEMKPDTLTQEQIQKSFRDKLVH